MRCALLVALVLLALPLAITPAPAADLARPLAGAELRALLTPALAAVPDIAARSHETGWRAAASPTLLARLDRVEQTLAEGLAALDSAEAGPIAPADRHALSAVLTPPSQPIAAAGLVGAWRCRKLLVDALGLFVYPFFDCAIAREGPCLKLTKPKGSQRLAGCLVPIGERSLVFLGEWRTDYEAGEEGGFLSQTAPDRLRLILPRDGPGFELIDLKRG